MTPAVARPMLEPVGGRCPLDLLGAARRVSGVALQTGVLSAGLAL